MINFKPISLEDKAWMDKLNSEGDMRGCEHSFANTFVWSMIYNNRVAEVEGFLVVKSGSPEHTQKYYYPSGKGSIKAVVEALIKDAQDSGHAFEIFGATPENIAELEAAFPGRFNYEQLRDIFDYVYSIEALSTLSGKKLHGKRNHINRFVQDNTDWSFEEITSENIKECCEMNEEWCKINCVNESQHQEYCAVRRSIKYFTELELEGGILRVNGKVAAFTIGEVLNSDTFVTHIEKAFSDIQGAYPMINKEFASYIHAKYPQIKYVNREEDVGSEGLRKAKLSYYPEFMIEKSKVTLK